MAGTADATRRWPVHKPPRISLDRRARLGRLEHAEMTAAARETSPASQEVAARLASSTSSRATVLATRVSLSELQPALRSCLSVSGGLERQGAQPEPAVHDEL